MDSPPPSDSLAGYLRCRQAYHTPIIYGCRTPSLFPSPYGIMLGAHGETRSVAMDNWNTELARTFHEETKHSYESVYRTRYFLDWPNQPQPFKRYIGLEAISLPADLPVTQLPALQALSPSGETGVTTSVPTLPDLAY